VVIEYCQDLDELNTKERKLITEELISTPQCYNIALGGQGGNLGDSVNKLIGLKSKETHRNMTIKQKVTRGNKIAKSLSGIKRSAAYRKKMSLSKKGTTFSPLVVEQRAKVYKQNYAKKSNAEKECYRHFGKDNGFYGKHHSDDTKNKIRQTIGDSRKGSLNANAKPVTIYGKTYSTQKECLADLNISRNKLIKLLGEQT